MSVWVWRQAPPGVGWVGGVSVWAWVPNRERVGNDSAAAISRSESYELRTNEPHRHFVILGSARHPATTLHSSGGGGEPQPAVCTSSL